MGEDSIVLYLSFYLIFTSSLWVRDYYYYYFYLLYKKIGLKSNTLFKVTQVISDRGRIWPQCHDARSA